MSLTEEEAKIYDRQIRLWGMDGQNRMRNTRLLVYGMTGASCEILKNLVLSGVGSVCVMDDSNVEVKDLGYQFFVRQEDVGENIAQSGIKRIQELNSFVKVSCDTGNIVDKGESFFNNFDIVLLTKCCLKIQKWVNSICRRKGILFITADMFGLLGISFQDLGNCFHYEVKKGKKTFEKEVDFVDLETVYKKSVDWSKHSKPWISGQCIMDFMDRFKKFPEDPEEFTKETLILLKKRNVDTKEFSEGYLKRICLASKSNLSPLCAVFGGIVSNEVIKSICRDSEPIRNYFVYDGIEYFCGIIESVGLD